MLQHTFHWSFILGNKCSFYLSFRLIPSLPHTYSPPSHVKAAWRCRYATLRAWLTTWSSVCQTHTVDVKTNTGPPPQLLFVWHTAVNEKDWCKDTPSAERNSQSHPAFWAKHKVTKLTWVGSRQVLIDTHRWHRRAQMLLPYTCCSLHVTRQSSGTCFSSCRGWAVGSRRWKKWFVAKTGFDDETLTVKL